MASSSAVTAVSLITLKFNHDGVSKRFKLPLRELGAATLENKLRGLLNIATATETRIERYSYSAGSWVVLKSSDISAYKQLYRAARAKQKLKLRVTTQDTATPEPKGPKPAAVEDAAEPEVETHIVQPLATNDAPQQGTMAQPAAARQDSSQLLAQVQPSQSLQTMLEHSMSRIESSVAALDIHDLSPPLHGGLVDSPPAPADRNLQHHTFVYCNSCDQTIPDAHFHCATCDDGDFDLCLACVGQNITCYGEDHWMIKRTKMNNLIINSTTERLAPKPKPTREDPVGVRPARSQDKTRCLPRPGQGVWTEVIEVESRTCNSCIREYPGRDFVHCAYCADFDLCKTCFLRNEHGHNPKHGFVPATEKRHLEASVLGLLAPGRAQRHNAICDQCDKSIVGIRHKCLDCPDFDLCHSCLQQSTDMHPGHRFVPLYEPTETSEQVNTRQAGCAVHDGILCDGPLCQDKGESAFIQGTRFKCAVCHDTDFCANCEAHPVHGHNRTHPLIKFKTPVRSVSVSTSSECHGKVLPVAGDRSPRRCTRPRHTRSRSTETVGPANVASHVQTVVNVRPSPSIQVEHIEQATPEPMMEKPSAVVMASDPQDLVAIYKSDTVVDGTAYPPNYIFEQTWILKNEGPTAWPAGCSVKFVGGDYMGHVDPSRPASISDLESSFGSTVCYAALAPGHEFPFTVLLRTPSRAGRVVSNWRLTTKDGQRFGHRLWCDVVVAPALEASAANVVAEKPQAMVTTTTTTTTMRNSSVSDMIFPKLDKESPLASMHEAASPYAATAAPAVEEEYEHCSVVEEWVEDVDEEYFLTDEEYDVLDASDEEYLEEQQVKAHCI